MVSKLLWTAAGLGVVYAAGKLLTTGPSLKGQVALITGGSRGLGYILAHAFAREGCRIIICGRKAASLRQAAAALEAAGADAMAVPCDVSDRPQVRRLIEQALDSMGRIDILVNNAGVIQVGPARQMRSEDFEHAMDVIFRGALHTIFEVLPHMSAARAGTIVNITSIGGKISVPHLLPYSCAKFAAVALSEGLHAELAGDGIHVLTVVPGLLRTGSSIQAHFKGQAEREYTWFAAGATAPGIAMNPERAAARIVRAVKKRESELMLPLWTSAAVGAHGLSPRLTQFLLTQVARLLPEPRGSDLRSIRGAEIAARAETRLARLIRWASARSIERYQRPEEEVPPKDIVQEASEESFPASDAPSWSSAHL